MVSTCEHVLAQTVQHLMHIVFAQAQCVMDLQALQGVDFGFAEMPIGQQGQGNNTCSGIRAVVGVGAHGGVALAGLVGHSPRIGAADFL